jgi:hypothetical protein
VTQQAAEKAGGMGGRRRRLLLLPQLVDLRLGLLKRVLLYQHSLRQDVECIRVGGQSLDQQLLGFRIFLRELGLLDATDKVVQHRFFLRGHLFSNVRRV